MKQKTKKKKLESSYTELEEILISEVTNTVENVRLNRNTGNKGPQTERNKNESQISEENNIEESAGQENVSEVQELPNKTVLEYQTIHSTWECVEEESTEQKSATKKAKLNNDTAPEGQGTHSRWQCTENPHTMQLRLQRVKLSTYKEESGDETADDSDLDPDFRMPSSSDSEISSESSRKEEIENITNETNGADSDNTQAYNKRKGKKRKANPVEWKKTKAKLL